MKKSKKPTLEECIQLNLERELKGYYEMLQHCPATPTRYFQEGERVLWGNHKEVYVEQILENGYIYLLKTIFHKDPTNQHERNLIDGEPSLHYQFWSKVFPYSMLKTPNVREFSVEDEIQLHFYQQDISSLLFAHYCGIDYSPEYQRGYVWSLEDKQMLIESIMHNVDIGKFTFVSLPYKVGHERGDLFYEILDGKQRMQTLVEFYEDRFEYKGKKFTELSFKDRYAFEGHSIVRGELSEGATREQILRTFIKLNTMGKVMDVVHLDKIRQEWLKELKK